jgi:signal transduction histidine kinase
MDLAVRRLPTLDRRVVDAVAVLACLVLTAWAVKGSWSPLPRPVVALAGTIGSLVQWRRRQWPQAAALVGSAAYVVSGNPGPLLIGLYTGASLAPRRQVWALVIAGGAGIAGLSWVEADHLNLKDIAFAALIAGFVVAVGVYVATRRALIASLRERADRAEIERELREEQARADERTRIAREMHDVLAHKMSLIALHAGALELQSTGTPPQIQQGATLIRVTAREALQELRTVLGILHTQPTEPFYDLAALVRTAMRAGQRIALDADAGVLPPPMARVVYRIVQEGLTNARKHAPDVPVTVAVHRNGDGSLLVSVRNGPPAHPPMDLPGSGAGLVGLAERIRLVGGTIRSGPCEGGWELRAVIPRMDAS